MENFDISNSQQNLFNVMQRSYERDGISGKAIKEGLRPKNYTDLIDFRSDVNYPHQSYGQLDGNSVIGTFGKQNSQASRLPQSTIDCTPRKNPEASRFNYAYDSQINDRLVDVSGVEIPNQYLRNIPNRVTQSAYQRQNIPTNPQIEKLVNDIMNISIEEPKTKNTLKYKASRQRLSRAELIGAVKIDEPTKPIPVFPVPPPP
jgi:hypothetical protein